jgi:hypothetical protein
MSNNKQSSVEWYFEQIRKEKYEEDIDWYGLFEQAKAMHKEEIKEALQEFLDTTLPDEVINEYYNETYGGNK